MSKLDLSQMSTTSQTPAVPKDGEYRVKYHFDAVYEDGQLVFGGMVSGEPFPATIRDGVVTIHHPRGDMEVKGEWRLHRHEACVHEWIRVPGMQPGDWIEYPEMVADGVWLRIADFRWYTP